MGPNNILKRSYTTTNWDSSQGHKGGSTQTKWCDTPQKQKKRQKPHDHLNKCRRSIWKHSTSIHDKSSYQSGYRGNISQNSNSYLWQTHSQYNTQWWKVESLPIKIWNKTMMPTLTTALQQSIWNRSHSRQTRKRNKRYPNWKGRGTIVIVFR